MSEPRLPVAGPSITELEIEYVNRAVRDAWYSEANTFHHAFERRCREHFQVGHAIALPSCTSALHLALAARGIGPGDEVIVPESTWIATSAPITYVGATPVFADVDRTTWCLDPNSVVQVLTPRTRAIIAVDLYGNVAPYEALRHLADDHGLLLVEDAAESVGALRHGAPAGNLADVGTVSLHGSKTVTAGEGGLLLTDDDDLAARARALMDHGRRPGDTDFFNLEVAFKYKMSSMQAALGLAQMERVDELVAMKRRIFGWYEKRLRDMDTVRLNQPGDGVQGAYWMSTMVWDPSLGPTATFVRKQLSAAGIDTRPFFHPLSSLPAYASHGGADEHRGRNPVSYAFSDAGLNLPSALSLTERDVERVAVAVRQLFGAR